MPNYVVGFAFDAEGEQLALIRKARPDWQRGKLNGVGGKIEFADFGALDTKRINPPTAVARVAMSREFHEETGVRIGTAEWTYLGSLHERDDSDASVTGSAVVHVFALFDDRALDCESTTDEAIGFYDPKALPSHVLPNLRWLVPVALNRRHTPFVITAEYAA